MKRVLFAFALFAAVAFGQTGTCSFTFLFTQATGFTSQPAPTAFDNRLKGCNAFTLNYQAIGLSAVTVQLNSATGATSQGTFGAYSGTTSSGANPSTNTTGTQATFTGYVGWLQVAVTGTPTGTTWRIQGTVYGAQTGGAGTLGPSTPIECLLPGAASCYTQGADANGAPPTGRPNLSASFDGTNVRDDMACIFQAVTILAPGTTGKIATNTAGGKKIKLCHVHETSGATTATVVIRSGTSLQCAVGTTTIDGAVTTAGFVFDYGPQSPLSANAANDDICMDFSGSVTATILAIWAEI
jgi:hypothetical protein